jgi:hypothetical protein
VSSPEHASNDEANKTSARREVTVRVGDEAGDDGEDA